MGAEGAIMHRLYYARQRVYTAIVRRIAAFASVCFRGRAVHTVNYVVHFYPFVVMLI